MPARKSLFNLNRLVADSGKDISPEISFLQDLDYTIRTMNKHESYYFKEINKNDNPEYFDSINKMVNTVVMTTLPKDNIEQYLYETSKYIIHTNDNKYYVCVKSSGKPSQKYKPSSLHCMRNMYYQMIGADVDKQSTKTSEMFSICESGEDRHIRIQRAISKMKSYGIDCEFIDVEDYVSENNLDLKVTSKKEFETKLYDEKRNLIFLCDGIIKYKGKYYILEIKTESSYKFMQRDNSDDLHKYQSYAYSLELKIDDVIFIYENRDLCSKKTFLVHITDENRQEIADRLSKCDEYVAEHIAPPKEESVTNKTCQYCEYKTICKLEDCI
jgi:CRISPR/Cas system-associated exonuclease Cas4 (RecB family)